jgi:predicted MFS family arabinose efflux permease
LTPAGPAPIQTCMDKRVLWMCIAVGSTVGGFVPELWGASAFGVTSLLFGAIGGVAGVWAAARISDYV